MDRRDEAIEQLNSRVGEKLAELVIDLAAALGGRPEWDGADELEFIASELNRALRDADLPRVDSISREVLEFWQEVEG
ncbi:hypothetical protein Q7C18_02870 [Nesterenkonia sp. CL21]|uniref:hypothetical protein n=1 Tax=Nesterenkonia sp. CL21 TaxID=3064894 RepID=UPI0028794B14|nr:hypothetical protein [Nesterenkonia sp. CL21]MDS2171630.1 hypothetical protein [Nesterenkonia sp. CL21]